MPRVDGSSCGSCRNQACFFLAWAGDNEGEGNKGGEKAKRSRFLHGAYMKCFARGANGCSLIGFMEERAEDWSATYYCIRAEPPSRTGAREGRASLPACWEEKAKLSHLVHMAAKRGLRVHGSLPHTERVGRSSSCARRWCDLSAE